MKRAFTRAFSNIARAQPSFIHACAAKPKARGLSPRTGGQTMV